MQLQNAKAKATPVEQHRICLQRHVGSIGWMMVDGTVRLGVLQVSSAGMCFWL